MKKAKTPISGSFTIGRDAFDKISAIEGRALTREMKRDFKRFDKENLSNDEHRKRLVAKYGNKGV